GGQRGRDQLEEGAIRLVEAQHRAPGESEDAAPPPPALAAPQPPAPWTLPLPIRPGQPLRAAAAPALWAARLAGGPERLDFFSLQTDRDGPAQPLVPQLLVHRPGDVRRGVAEGVHGQREGALLGPSDRGNLRQAAQGPGPASREVLRG